MSSHRNISDKAREFADAAFKTIEAYGLLPTPENYELWYVHVSGTNSELSRTINLLCSANNQNITDSKCFELYQKFLSGDHERDKVKEAGDQIQKTIEEINEAVNTANFVTTEYGKSLEDVNEQLKEEKSKEEIGALLNVVLSDTRTMIDQNRYLESLLEDSAKTMDALKRDLEDARKEAMTDALTGLMNRKGFDTEIEKAVADVKTGKIKTFSLIFLDIDHFKSFNDSFGHQVGDQVLKLVARTIKEGVKGRDVAARYGGEEFAVILPDTSMESGVKVGESLRQSVAKKEVINRMTGEQIARITLSAGVSEYDMKHDLYDLVSSADYALYAAKNGGRNQVLSSPVRASLKKS